MIKQPIQYNADRYNYKADGGSWKLSATESKYVPPINFTPKPNIEFEVVPELQSNGVIIHVADAYLVSQETLDNISASANPHYDYQNNGSIKIKGKETIVGQTLPILKVDLSNLNEVAQKRNQIGNYAGVADVLYTHQTPTVKGIPQGVIDQLNYTLVQDIERPSDKFSIWDLGLEADYSLETLKIETQQGDKVLDKTKLKKFLAGVADKLALLRKDFNTIKGIYYRGLAPTNNTRTIDFDRQAITEDSEQELVDKQKKQQVFKQSQIVSVESTPVSQAATTADTALTTAKTPPQPSGSSTTTGGTGISGATMAAPTTLGSGMSANSAPPTRSYGR